MSQSSTASGFLQLIASGSGGGRRARFVRGPFSESHKSGSAAGEGGLQMGALWGPARIPAWIWTPLALTARYERSGRLIRSNRTYPQRQRACYPGFCRLTQAEVLEETLSVAARISG